MPPCNGGHSAYGPQSLFEGNATLQQEMLCLWPTLAVQKCYSATEATLLPTYDIAHRYLWHSSMCQRAKVSRRHSAQKAILLMALSLTPLTFAQLHVASAHGLHSQVLSPPLPPACLCA
eukprot:1105596-Pelagomonas_calceolata.AAC.6